MKTPPPAAASGPDMRKEYRKELRATETKLRAISRDQRKHHRAAERAVRRAEDAAIREIRAVKRAAAALDRGWLKQSAALVKRRDILAGRLA